MTTFPKPQWITEITKNFTVGEDMLGVEGAAQSYQQWLIPGVISTTERARYYSFYAWALYRFINLPSGSRLLKDFRGKFYKRHEVAFILGAYSHHKNGETLKGLVGSGTNDSKVRSWWEDNDPVCLDAHYFKNALGGFGQYYRTAMQVMGIVGEKKRPTWVYPLTSRGEKLAKAFEASIKNTAYQQKLEQTGQLKFLSHEDATEYGQSSCLCQEALQRGQDLPLLRDAFFRFDQKGNENAHFRRRMALGVTLDLVRGANGKFQRSMLRPALYLEEYIPNFPYQAMPELKDWVLRWRLVSIRHLYTFGLQCLWGSFLLELSQKVGLSLLEYMQWAENILIHNVFNQKLGDKLNNLCTSVGLPEEWEESSKKFGKTCLQESKKDEYSLYLRANRNPEDSALLLDIGLQCLLQFFLRFRDFHKDHPIWMEMTNRERLPITHFFEFMEKMAKSDVSLGKWLETLYKEFILSQHEHIAFGKLRYQGYDTFKFYLREGRFYWPFHDKKAYREPIRLAGNRLNNALSILENLGLVFEDDKGVFSLTNDGENYLEKIVENL